MKKGDFLWIFILGIFMYVMISPLTHEIFVNLTKVHPYLGGFIKFFILATMGELLAIRITIDNWKKPSGILYRALIWGFLGIVIVLIFSIFGQGVKESLANEMLPGGNSKFAYAFLVSTIMNTTFAPTMMAFHRITDTFIDLKYESEDKVTINNVVSSIDWNGFVSFVILKTIPFFWIPAHTITFLLPPEYRVLVAALLSVALGVILAFAKRQSKQST